MHRSTIFLRKYTERIVSDNEGGGLSLSQQSLSCQSETKQDCRRGNVVFARTWGLCCPQNTRVDLSDKIFTLGFTDSLIHNAVFSPGCFLIYDASRMKEPLESFAVSLQKYQGSIHNPEVSWLERVRLSGPCHPVFSRWSHIEVKAALRNIL